MMIRRRLRTAILASAIFYAPVAFGAQRFELGKIDRDALLAAAKLPSVDSGCFVEDGPLGALYAYSAGEEEDSLWIYLNGEYTELKFQSSTQNHDKPEKNGDTFTKIYRKGELRLSLQSKVLRICGKKEDQCESFDYEFSFTLTGPQGKSIKMEKLKGGCGS